MISRFFVYGLVVFCCLVFGGFWNLLFLGAFVWILGLYTVCLYYVFWVGFCLAKRRGG